MVSKVIKELVLPRRDIGKCDTRLMLKDRAARVLQYYGVIQDSSNGMEIFNTHTCLVPSKESVPLSLRKSPRIEYQNPSSQGPVHLILFW